MARWGIRLVLTGLLFPLGFLILVVALRFCAARLGFSTHQSMQISGFLTFCFAIVSYILIWRGMVQWNTFRQRGTVAAVALAHPIGIPLGVLLARGDDDFGWFLSAVLPIGVVVLASLVFWVQFPIKQKRASVSVPCPKCGYDLRGLFEARCPECGSRFTLEQLVITQG